MEHEIAGQAVKAAMDGALVGTADRKKEPMTGKKALKAMERVMNALFFICGMVAVAFVLLISIYLIISGLPAILEIGPINFLFGTRWYASTGDFGIFAIILTSFAGTAGAILVGVPIGLLPLVGMILLVPAIRVAFDLPSGATLLAAIIVLAVMILPSIVSVSETALRAVPREYEEASLALGATHIETVFRVSVPAARSGIATAIVLGIGRAIGEAMAIIMVAGNVANMPGLLTPVRFLTTAIASEMSYASVGSLHRNALFSIGLVLFLFIMLINVFLNVFIKRKKED